MISYQITDSIADPLMSSVFATFVPDDCGLFVSTYDFVLSNVMVRMHAHYKGFLTNLHIHSCFVEQAIVESKFADSAGGLPSRLPLDVIASLCLCPLAV